MNVSVRFQITVVMLFSRYIIGKTEGNSPAEIVRHFYVAPFWIEIRTVDKFLRYSALFWRFEINSFDQV